MVGGIQIPNQKYSHNSKVNKSLTSLVNNTVFGRGYQKESKTLIRDMQHPKQSCFIGVITAVIGRG